MYSSVICVNLGRLFGVIWFLGRQIQIWEHQFSEPFRVWITVIVVLLQDTLTQQSLHELAVCACCYIHLNSKIFLGRPLSSLSWCLHAPAHLHFSIDHMHAGPWMVWPYQKFWLYTPLHGLTTHVSCLPWHLSWILRVKTELKETQRIEQCSWDIHRMMCNLLACVKDRLL